MSDLDKLKSKMVDEVALAEARVRLYAHAERADDQLSRDLKILLGDYEHLIRKSGTLTERVRESSGVIKLLYRGKHPKQIAICNEVLDKNSAAIAQ